MADIGDSYTISTVITVADVPTDPTSITLTVTDPVGATSTPAVSPTGTGAYAATVTLDQAGRWRWKWTTTGPDGIDHGYVDVAVDPPARLDLLASVDDLEARYGTLSTDQAARAPALLEDASGLVRDFCTVGLQILIDDERILRPVGSLIRLPEPPITAVTAVTAIARDGGPDIALAGWSWDGIDLVDVREATFELDTGQATWWDKIDQHTNTYRVIYTHGPPTTPRAAKAKVCQMVNRVLSSPSRTEGVVDRRIGQYGEQYQQGTGSTGVGVILTKADERDLIRSRLRIQSDTVGVRAR